MGEPWDYPPAQGLYDPSRETAACGVGFIVNIDGESSAKVIRDAEKLASRMKHRGACSCDNDTGDGAGLMAAIPHSFYAALLQEEGVELPEPGRYATGIFYFDKPHHEESENLFDELAASHGLKLHRKIISPFHFVSTYVIPEQDLMSSHQRDSKWTKRRRQN